MVGYEQHLMTECAYWEQRRVDMGFVVPYMGYMSMDLPANVMHAFAEFLREVDCGC